MSAVPVESHRDAARRLATSALQRGYRAEALHEYRDAEGNPVKWRIRCKHPETGEKWIRPMHWTGTGYAIGEPEAPEAGRMLYRLPELLADPAEIVWIVEGEVCADALAKVGRVATTSGSASSASGADWTPLRGRSVRLWPDHDEPGKKYADAAEAILSALGCTVERVDTGALGLPDGGDVVDWLAAGGVDLAALPLADNPAVRFELGHRLPTVELLRGDSIVPEAVDWLWGGWMAAGKLQILGGQPGTGKTTIATALAATVTIGSRWPDGTRAAVGNVVIWSGEDDPADTLVPRLRAAGADMARVHFIDGMREGADRYPFDPARDSDALLEALAEIGDVRLLVIDPIVSAVAGDSHKNAEVRRGLQPLVDLAQRQRCALLGITHFTKGTAGREPVERITGSLAFGALARVVMVTAKVDAKDGEAPRRFLARAKSNIGPDGGGFLYDLHQGELLGFPGVAASSVLWGTALEGTARELLADAEQQGDDAGQDAAGFLRELLGYGPRPVKDIYRDAEAAGFSRDAMKRAKRRIGAEAAKQGMVGGWTWCLPAKEGSGERSEGCEGSEGSAQIYPPPSHPSGEEAPPSEAWEVVEL